MKRSEPSVDSIPPQIFRFRFERQSGYPYTSTDRQGGGARWRVCSEVLFGQMANLCAALLLALSGSSAAQDIPCVSLTTGTKTVTVVNQCAQQIWLAERGNTDVPPPSGWALAPQCLPVRSRSAPRASPATKPPGRAPAPPIATARSSFLDPTAACDMTTELCVRSAELVIPSNWSGRFWPRTGCSGGSSSLSCQTGQCGPSSGGNIDCNMELVPAQGEMVAVDGERSRPDSKVPGDSAEAAMIEEGFVEDEARLGLGLASRSTLIPRPRRCFTWRRRSPPERARSAWNGAPPGRWRRARPTTRSPMYCW